MYIDNIPTSAEVYEALVVDSERLKSAGEGYTPL